MYTYQLASFPIQQVGPLAGVETKLAQGVAGRTYPVRLIVRSRPFDMAPPLRAVRGRAGDIARLLATPSRCSTL